MDLDSELDRATRELDKQIAKSNFLTRWIAKVLVKSKYRDNIKRGITHGTNVLEDVIQKL
jgi:hypothetical protein